MTTARWRMWETFAKLAEVDHPVSRQRRFVSRSLRGRVASRERWQIAVAFAVLGLAITAAVYVAALLHDYTKPLTPTDSTLALAGVILCPFQLLFIACIDCEVDTSAGLIVYLTCGLLNAGLYAAIGATLWSWAGNHRSTQISR